MSIGNQVTWITTLLVIAALKAVLADQNPVLNTALKAAEAGDCEAVRKLLGGAQRAAEAAGKDRNFAVSLSRYVPVAECLYPSCGRYDKTRDCCHRQSSIASKKCGCRGLPCQYDLYTETPLLWKSVDPSVKRPCICLPD